MGKTIKQEAEEYEARFKVISDVEKVSVELEMEDGTETYLFERG